jgi:molybdopterin/thiamine biosynthesis adenylyltransferase
MTPELQHEVRSQILSICRTIQDPAGRPVKVIGESEAGGLASKYQVHQRAVYIEALWLHIWPCRYVRNTQSMSIADQLKLAQSRVAVIGAGGLGGQIILLLARMGIGALVIVDPDGFDETNLNRQALAFDHTLDIPKAKAAAKVLASVNPAVEVIAVVDRFSAQNSPRLLAGVDVIADALDNIPDRLVLQEQAAQLNIPLVYGTVAGFDGQVMTIYPGEIGLRAVYGAAGTEDSTSNAESTLGVPAVTPALIGSLQVMEIIKILLNRSHVCHRKMMYAELESGKFMELNMSH